MQVESFRRLLPSLWEGDSATADHPIDRKFIKVIDVTQGMATENKLAVLNLAASLMTDDEVYLEIGTYVGTSVIGASLDNDDKRFIAIDNFSQFGGPEEQCRENLATFNCDNVDLWTEDGWEAIKRVDKPIGVYLYDGGHTYAEQVRAFSAAESKLADKAIVIVDDVSHNPVRAADDVWCKNNPQYELIARFESPTNGEPKWWNGIDIWSFDRSKQSRPGINGSRHAINKLRYGPLYENTLIAAHKAVGAVRKTTSNA